MASTCTRGPECGCGETCRCQQDCHYIQQGSMLVGAGRQDPTISRGTSQCKKCQVVLCTQLKRKACKSPVPDRELLSPLQQVRPCFLFMVLETYKFQNVGYSNSSESLEIIHLFHKEIHVFSQQLNTSYKKENMTLQLLHALQGAKNNENATFHAA